MENLIQLLISGLSLGSLYAIISLGFVIIYRGSSVLNFAHGEFLTLGAMLMISIRAAGLPWLSAFIATLIITGLVAMLVERSILRSLVGRPVFVTIIMTLFIGLVLRIFVVMIWGTDSRGMPTPWDTTSTVKIFGANVLFNSLAGMFAAAICVVLFFIIQKYTKFGIAMRASSLDQESALAVGVPVGKIFGLSWFIAGVLAAVGGIFLGMFPSSVDTNLGFVAFKAFPAIILGGLESPTGALLASLMLGILEVTTQTYVNPHLGDFGRDFHVVFPYLVMLLFMIFRPYGFFGKREVERV